MVAGFLGRFNDNLLQILDVRCYHYSITNQTDAILGLANAWLRLGLASKPGEPVYETWPVIALSGYKWIRFVTSTQVSSNPQVYFIGKYDS